MHLVRWAAVALIVVGASGCATRNVLPDGTGGSAMLAGNDPVSYHTQPQPVRGNPAITAEWDGGTYRFANEANRALFVKEPAKYAPQYGGWCANGAPYSILLGGGANAYKIVNGRLYMFSGPDSKKYWEMDEARNIQRGDQYWETEMKHVASARLHSYRRILFKVPHYKTGKELEAEWQTRQARKSG
jgi:YHS domain-containing protein